MTKAIGRQARVRIVDDQPANVRVLAEALKDSYVARRPPGVFLVEPFDSATLAHGVLGGLAVEAQVRPFVNLKTVAASSITLKEFFIAVAKVHR